MRITEIKKFADNAIYSDKKKDFIIEQFQKSIIPEMNRIKTCLLKHIKNSRIPLDIVQSLWRTKNSVLYFGYRNDAKFYRHYDSMFTIANYSIASRMLALAHNFDFAEFLIIIKYDPQIKFSVNLPTNIHNSFQIEYNPTIYLMMDKFNSMLYYQYAFEKYDYYYLKILKSKNKTHCTEKTIYVAIRKTGYALFKDIIYNKLMHEIRIFQNKMRESHEYRHCKTSEKSE
jgi:hypothetical protein